MIGTQNKELTNIYFSSSFICMMDWQTARRSQSLLSVLRAVPEKGSPQLLKNVVLIRVLDVTVASIV